MLSAFCGPDTTWCSVDINTCITPRSAQPPKSLVELGVFEENQVWLAELFMVCAQLQDYGSKAEMQSWLL
eukprot:20398-Amphidinium_carterae.1